MRNIHCLNNISAYGTDLLTDDYQLVDDLTQAEGVLVRSAALHDTAFPESLQAIARAGNGLEAFGERGVVQGGAADEHAFRLGEVVDELVVVGEQVGAVRRDVVEAVDVAHEVSFEDGRRHR